MNFSLKDLIKENLKLFEGRREDAQAKYTDVPERIFNIFVEEEPSGNYKYLDWIMKIWQQEMCGYSSSYRCGNVSVAKNMMNNISYFNENPHKYEIKDINGFTSFANFTNSTNDAKLKLTKGELKKQATKHYETGRYLIVEPHSHASSCFFMVVAPNGVQLLEIILTILITIIKLIRYYILLTKTLVKKGLF